MHERIQPHIAAFAREELDTLALRLPTAAGKVEHAAAPGYMLSPRAVSILLVIFGHAIGSLGNNHPLPS